MAADRLGPLCPARPVAGSSLLPGTAAERRRGDAHGRSLAIQGHGRGSGALRGLRAQACEPDRPTRSPVGGCAARGGVARGGPGGNAAGRLPRRSGGDRVGPRTVGRLPRVGRPGRDGASRAGVPVGAGVTSAAAPRARAAGMGAQSGRPFRDRRVAVPAQGDRGSRAAVRAVAGGAGRDGASRPGTGRWLARGIHAGGACRA